MRGEGEKWAAGRNPLTECTPVFPLTPHPRGGVNEGGHIPVQVTLRAGPGEESTASGVLHHLSPVARVSRVAVILLVSALVAALLIPIPIIHLVGIPLALLIGVAVAVRQGRCVVRLERVGIACPRCGERNHLGGGLGFRTATGPITTQCSSCRRVLELGWREGEG